MIEVESPKYPRAFFQLDEEVATSSPFEQRHFTTYFCIQPFDYDFPDHQAWFRECYVRTRTQLHYNTIVPYNAKNILVHPSQ